MDELDTSESLLLTTLNPSRHDSTLASTRIGKHEISIDNISVNKLETDIESDSEISESDFKNYFESDESFSHEYSEDNNSILSDLTNDQQIEEKFQLQLNNNFSILDKSFTFRVQDFEHQQFIFVTNHSKVGVFKYKPLGLLIAVKMTNMFSFENKDAIHQAKKLKMEASILKTLSTAPNIIDFYGVFEVKNNLWFCMELMDMSLEDLYYRIHSNGSKFPDKLLSCITTKVLDGLIFAKCKNIIHRDIKPLNILINWSGQIKLCDFGVSTFMKNSAAHSSAGTIAYWPPERFTNSEMEYDVRFDIWSLGITLIEAITGNIKKYLCFEIDDYKEPINIGLLPDRIKNIHSEKLVQAYVGSKNHYSSKLATFINLCLQPYDKRPKYEQLTTTELYQTFHSMTESAIEELLRKGQILETSMIQLTIRTNLSDEYYSKQFPVLMKWQKFIIKIADHFGLPFYEIRVNIYDANSKLIFKWNPSKVKSFSTLTLDDIGLRDKYSVYIIHDYYKKEENVMEEVFTSRDEYLAEQNRDENLPEQSRDGYLPEQKRGNKKDIKEACLTNKKEACLTNKKEASLKMNNHLNSQYPSLKLRTNAPSIFVDGSGGRNAISCVNYERASANERVARVASQQAWKSNFCNTTGLTPLQANMSAPWPGGVELLYPIKTKSGYEG